MVLSIGLISSVGGPIGIAYMVGQLAERSTSERAHNRASTIQNRQLIRETSSEDRTMINKTLDSVIAPTINRLNALSILAQQNNEKGNSTEKLVYANIAGIKTINEDLQHLSNSYTPRTVNTRQMDIIKTDFRHMSSRIDNLAQQVYVTQGNSQTLLKLLMKKKGVIHAKTK